MVRGVSKPNPIKNSGKCFLCLALEKIRFRERHDSGPLISEGLTCRRQRDLFSVASELQLKPVGLKSKETDFG